MSDYLSGAAWVLLFFSLGFVSGFIIEHQLRKSHNCDNLVVEAYNFGLTTCYKKGI